MASHHRGAGKSTVLIRHIHISKPTKAWTAHAAIGQIVIVTRMNPLWAFGQQGAGA
jgi:hypothetical protein